MADNDLILVTGASGFVGKWCVIKLLEKGYRVRGTVRSDAKAALVRKTVPAIVGADAASRLNLVKADILADAGWPDALGGGTAGMLVATEIRGDEPKDASSVVRPAVEGTERVLRMAHQAGIRRFILTSSIATVGYGHGHTKGRRVYGGTCRARLEAVRWSWAF